MIFLLFSLFKPSLGNEIIYSDGEIYYLAEVRTLFTETNENSSFIFSLRSGLISPPDTFYISIDRALITLKHKGFELFLGRENISWGYGLFYSPFSYARSIASPFDAELLRKGQNIAGIRYQNISFMTPELIFFLPRQNPELNNSMIGMRTNFLFGNLELHTPIVFAKDSIFTGSSIRYSLFDFTLFLDYSLTYSEEEFLHSTVTGINRYIGSNFFIQAEYFYNQKGLTSEEYDNLSPPILSQKLSFGYTGRHYLYTTLQCIFREENTISLYSLVHPKWKSGLVGLSFSSTRFNNILVILNLIRILKGREFEYIPSRNIYSLKFRYYF